MWPSVTRVWLLLKNKFIPFWISSFWIRTVCFPNFSFDFSDEDFLDDNFSNKKWKPLKFTLEISVIYWFPKRILPNRLIQLAENISLIFSLQVCEMKMI